MRDCVALEGLAVGTVLRTCGGPEATVLGLTWKHGDVEVCDIEVLAGPGRGLHDFFVRGPEGDGPGVLVHNGCGEEVSDLAAAQARGAKTTEDVGETFKRPGDHHGIDAKTASERLHDIK